MSPFAGTNSPAFSLFPEDTYKLNSFENLVGNVAVFDTKSRIPGDKFCFALNGTAAPPYSVRRPRVSKMPPRHIQRDGPRLPKAAFPYSRLSTITPARGNLIQKAKNMIPLLVPLFVSAFRRATDLAMAMEARCYRGRNADPL